MVKNKTIKLYLNFLIVVTLIISLNSCLLLNSVFNSEDPKEDDSLGIFLALLGNQVSGSSTSSEESCVIGDSCNLGTGGRIDVGLSNSFFTKVVDAVSGNTTECSFKANFNDGSEKTIYLTSNGNGQTVLRKDSCGTICTVAATQPDTFIAAEIMDQHLENLAANPTAPANNLIIPGAGAGNETTNATHVQNVRTYLCSY